ncbi:hypothetical protein NEUTE1DRAFT_108550 [Neurospora tetrasperma FGSC 2508]|uniref:Uncharacterized protein n=1 Tax=Neurospora tetrasperma (strain FGSC 2508 / ATCC MYA-4615 / P0657) TaxID=510951 RepID=F8MII5_NEUT8|nr:uncharacterized protein NEUTE1DRAFT_108550 [Neurospora tetrasperma FGSC 2508]EGO58989.1 hypothetical protein NEUTE1DRAFT_108550 [Neurospora tetrasperma FGSC 2508]EGZ73090.1 hypothetical protein NEUTE2DRAFT_165261 [Neurospora tetrasperma FGSC 2509]
MEPQVPFEDYARPRPLRTYSHKVRTASPSVLPLLRATHSPASLAKKHQREPEPGNKDRLDNGIIPEEETFAYQAEYAFEEANELEFELQYASDTSHSPGDYATEEDTGLEYSTDEDKDERGTTEESKTTPTSSVRFSSGTKYIPKTVTDQSNLLRRRPFLLFDKLPPRGFKRLKRKVEESTTASLSAKYKFGDGFSKDEAKPNGLVQLGLRPTAKRKAPQVKSRVGALDLTQSSFASPPQKDHIVNHKKKTTMMMKRAYDNSFLPDPRQTERQRKRRKLLKKKDNPLEDKELLPTVLKPKIILESVILGKYANQVEGRQHMTAVPVSEQQRKQTQNLMESALEVEGDVPMEDHEEENEPQAAIAREPSVELGESPARMNVSARSSPNHQETRHQQQEALEEQAGNAVQVLTEEGGEWYVQEHLEQPLEPFFEKPVQKPAQKPVEEQKEPGNNDNSGADDPKTAILKKSTDAKSTPITDLSSSKCGTVDQSQIDTTTDPAKLTSHDTLGEQHYRQSQKSHQAQVKIQGQDAPPSEMTSPGSGWETYISETDIRTPTPLRPLNSRAKSAVPSTSRGPENPGLKRSNSAV